MARESTTPRLRVAAAFLIVLAAATLPFLDALRAGFLSDDYLGLALYRQAQAQVPPWQFAIDAIATNARVPTAFYRPLAFASLWLETQVWGARAWPFHLTNLLLHAGVCLLTLTLVRQLGRQGQVLGLLPAVIATVLFAAFPRRVEAVAWISCRPDLLAAVFALAAAITYMRAVERASVLLEWIAAALWLIALLNKESALLLPLAVLALRSLLPPPLPREAAAPRGRLLLPLVPLAPFAAAGSIYLALRRLALGVWIGGYGADQLRPSPLALLKAVRHIVYLVLPPLDMIDRDAWIAPAIVAAALLALILLARYARPVWQTPLVRLGAAWIVVTILPIAALPVSLSTTFNDRLLYLPGLGMACALAGALSRVDGRVLLSIGGTAALISGIWTAALAHRWHIAGTLSDALVRQLAASIDGEQRTVYLASVPDSYRGAYMLRTAIPEALQVTGGMTHVPRVVVLTRYFVERPDVCPIEALRTAPAHLRIHARDGRPALLLEPQPPSAGVSLTPAAVPAAAADPYGRYVSVDAALAADGGESRVLLVTPGGLLTR